MVVVGEDDFWDVVGAIGERVKGDVVKIREDDEGTSEGKGEDELRESEEREGCCRENE